MEKEEGEVTDARETLLLNLGGSREGAGSKSKVFPQSYCPLQLNVESDEFAVMLLFLLNLCKPHSSLSL